jgi:hypothetical protein
MTVERGRLLVSTSLLELYYKPIARRRQSAFPTGQQGCHSGWAEQKAFDRATYKLRMGDRTRDPVFMEDARFQLEIDGHGIILLVWYWIFVGLPDSSGAAD